MDDNREKSQEDDVKLTAEQLRELTFRLLMELNRQELARKAREWKQ
jgi:hypothetical protein